MKALRTIGLLILLGSAPAAQAAGLAEEMQLRLRSGSETATEEATQTLAALARFYEERAMTPLWVEGNGGATPRAQELARLLGEAERDGLDPSDYGVEAIQPLLDAEEHRALAELEMRLSLGLMRFAADLGQGRIEPHKVDPEQFREPQEIDRAAVIRGAADASDMAAFVDGYRPRTPRYERVRQALADYRDLVAAGGWAPIPEGPTLKPGMTDPRVGLLRARLRLWGDLAAEDDLAAQGGDPDFYDDALVAAVEWMQYRHGLEQDGKVGRKTTAALNVPAEARVEQLLINLERRRWMPDDFGQRYVFINLADFILKVVDEPKTIFATRVVVGDPYHRTPVFSQDMTYIVINPYWNVPPSIARKEILPKLKKNPNYLTERNFTLLSDWSADAHEVDPQSIDWSQVSGRGFRWKIRQNPGDGNALGRIKFMLPNRFDVYLHDTPARALFAKSRRTFSHGCIRVEGPDRLAAVVLDGQGEWSEETVNAAIDSGERQIVSLSERLPVHLTYLTAWVNKDGSVHFRDDVYERDAILADALLGPRPRQQAANE